MMRNVMLCNVYCSEREREREREKEKTKLKNVYCRKNRTLL